MLPPWLSVLNSATKYPSIPTYHPLGAKGKLLPEPISLSGTLRPTEKVDGTNTRLIFTRHAEADRTLFLIGSREELLHAQGDLVYNPALGIVDAVVALAERLSHVPAIRERVDLGKQIVTLYVEVFGGKTTSHAKEYGQAIGVRMFDVSLVDPVQDLDPGGDLGRIALWREHGGQRFLSVPELEALAISAEIPLVPHLADIPAESLPTDPASVLAFLKAQTPETRCRLEPGAGRSEGLVVRSHDRKQIVKLRYEDYERHLRGK